jgi:acyl-CoA thioesterase I
MTVIGRLAMPPLLLALIACGPVAMDASLAAAHRPGVSRAVLTSPPPHRPAPRQPARGTRPTVRLLFVGASVTAGYGALDPAHAYPDVVAGHLRAGGWNTVVHIVAHPGATAGEAETWPVKVRSDAVVVHLVTNDFARGTRLADYQAEYSDVISRVRESSPRAKLVCLGGWDAPSAVNAAGIAAARYNDVARAVCSNAGGDYVDISGLYLQSDDHGPVGTLTAVGVRDAFHPNDLGHRKLAAAVLRALGMPSGAPGSRSSI